MALAGSIWTETAEQKLYNNHNVAYKFQVFPIWVITECYVWRREIPRLKHLHKLDNQEIQPLSNKRLAPNEDASKHKAC